jgi:hypothetical protein
MNHRHNHMYMIVCKKNTLLCYYTLGIQLVNIPFERVTVVALQKITWYGQRAFRKNLLPSFEQFQRAYRLWFKAYKNPKYLRQRETGFAVGEWSAHPHHFANYYRQTYKKTLFSYETTLGL